jgi:hypothetical protein
MHFSHEQHVHGHMWHSRAMLFEQRMTLLEVCSAAARRVHVAVMRLQLQEVEGLGGLASRTFPLHANVLLPQVAGCADAPAAGGHAGAGAHGDRQRAAGAARGDADAAAGACHAEGPQYMCPVTAGTPGAETAFGRRINAMLLVSAHPL